MRYDPKTTLLSTYRPPELLIDCAQCKRTAVVATGRMIKRFGDVTLADLAIRVAAARGCAQANSRGPIVCGARPYDLPVDHWATLEDALLGGWTCMLYCRRSMAVLKPTTACPGPVPLDVRVLVASLGYGHRLDRLKHKAICPSCGTSAVDLVWEAPASRAGER